MLTLSKQCKDTRHGRADLALDRSKRGGRNRVDLDASQIVLIADRLQDRKRA
jgi:hypothetical protein